MTEQQPTGTPRQVPAAGWYPDPQMPGTNRYWDGARWSEHVAPMTTPQPRTNGIPLPVTIAVGILLAVVVLWLVYAFATANDGLDCATESADRVLNGQSSLDCD